MKYEERSIQKSLEELLYSEEDLYSEAETLEDAEKHIKNAAMLADRLIELEKVRTEKYKTEAEVNLKDRMNKRDNETKKEIADADRKLKKIELIANKTEGGLTIVANILKGVSGLAVTGAILSCECNGYSVPNSKAFRYMDNCSKLVIKNKF